MSDFIKKYQRWLADFTKILQLAQREQMDNLFAFSEQFKAYLKAGKDLTAYETQMFLETLKRQWHELDEEHQVAPPSLWPEALWQELSLITDKSQLEWQELTADFKHQGVYYQGETVGLGRYRCNNCLQHIDYTHPAELLACSHCGGVHFFREGLPV